MSSVKLAYTTVKEICKPVGRPQYALDFGVDTSEITPDDLKPLIGTTVYLTANSGPFASTRSDDKWLTITDISATKIYGKRGKYGPNGETVEVNIKDVSCINWTEKVTKRIAVMKSAAKR